MYLFYADVDEMKVRETYDLTETTHFLPGRLSQG